MSFPTVASPNIVADYHAIKLDDDEKIDAMVNDQHATPVASSEQHEHTILLQSIPMRILKFSHNDDGRVPSNSVFLKKYKNLGWNGTSQLNLVQNQFSELH